MYFLIHSNTGHLEVTKMHSILRSIPTCNMVTFKTHTFKGEEEKKLRNNIQKHLQKETYFRAPKISLKYRIWWNGFFLPTKP